MGLCLHVFSADFGSATADPEELAACDIGAYSYFKAFRDTIAATLNADQFPVLMQHSDCDGVWRIDEIPMLERELNDIAFRFRELPPKEIFGASRRGANGGAGDGSLYDCFRIVGGENLFEALLSLCVVARKHRRPITFM